MKTKQILFTFAFSTAAAVASNDIRLGQPGYGGTGCPAGSVSASLSPDNKQISLLFDAFTVEARGSTRIDRKNCNIAIPVHVPQGYSVSVIAIDYRGYNSLPSGAQSTFTAEYFLAGSVGPRYQQTFRGQLDDEYLITNNLQLTGLVWSPCGASTILRTNAAMRVQTNSRGQQALATVDSMDVDAGLVYHLQWRQCR
jgi:hypothetical protein